MAVVGPGAQTQDDVAPAPSLEGASEYEYVTILNPLSDDFAIQVAQDKPVNLPFEIRKDGNTSTITNTEQDVRTTYGLALKNPDHKAKAHIVNSTIIRAGKTINLKGNEAQVAVKQLVDEIIQREGNTTFLADPNVRREVEERIIIARGSMQELMDGNLMSPQAQLNEAITKSNEAKANEPEFPGLDRAEPLREHEGVSGQTGQNTTTTPPQDGGARRGRKPASQKS